MAPVDTPVLYPEYTLLLGKCGRRHFQKEIWVHRGVLFLSSKQRLLIFRLCSNTKRGFFAMFLVCPIYCLQFNSYIHIYIRFHIFNPIGEEEGGGGSSTHFPLEILVLYPLYTLYVLRILHRVNISLHIARQGRPFSCDF